MTATGPLPTPSRTPCAESTPPRGPSARPPRWIRSTLDETVQRLDRGLSLNDLGELQRMPADFDRAVTLRQHHWQVLGALLTEAELETLKPATLPAP
jgi:hypothetical protein